MDKNGVATFGDWFKGQVKHPIYGFGLLQNVEVFENKGIAKLKPRAILDSTIAPTRLPIAEVYDIYGNTYTLTSVTGQGVLYKNGTVIASGLNNAWDLCIYKDYLLVRYSSVIGAFGPLSAGGAAWFPAIQTGFSTVYNGKLLVGQDDYVYSGNGNYVARMEVTGAAVGVAPTITVNLSALDLKDGEYVSTLVEYGKNIMIGTHGGGSYSDRGNSQIAKLYPWNRQLGTLGNPGLADLPIVFAENGINAIFQHANKLYVQAGTQGNVYVTDSTNYQLIGRLPYTISGVNSGSTAYTNAMNISSQGCLLIGLSGELNDYSRAGIYEIDIADPSYPVQYRQPTGKTTGTLSIGFVNTKSYQTTKVGWANNAVFGVDTSDFVLYTSFGGVIETDLRKVGTYDNKATFEHIEWCLAEPLVSGQKIRISYRKNNKEAYTEINTWGFVDATGVKGLAIDGIGPISFADVGAIADAEYVQLKIELDQSAGTVFGSNLNLISVRIW